jgi:P pilus assembly chaperone PapD
VALRFRVLSRSIGADGREENAPADGLFVVYPSRLLVEAGAAASVKLQWKGPAVADSERCFRFVAEQVPIDAAGPRGSGLKIMFRYVASLYVGEASFAPELRATATGASGPDGRSGYLVEIRNAGKRHVIASGARLRFAGDAAPLTSAELGELSGANYLPASSRSAFVPRPEAEQGKTYEVELEYDAVY